MEFLFKIVRKEVTAGVLIGGVCLSCLLWFLAYTQEKAQTFAAFTVYANIEHDF